MKGNGQGLNLAGPLGVFLGRMDSFKAYFWAGRRTALERVTASNDSRSNMVSSRSGCGHGRISLLAAALTPLPSSAAVQELAWQHGRAYFRFTDWRGQYGRPGKSYHAWRLPNSFRGPHHCLPRGRQRRLNRQLADLCIKRAWGTVSG
jgi:hypothetical protein